MTEKVYVASNAGTKCVYHVRENCQRLRETVREWTEEDARALEYEKCKICSDSVDQEETPAKPLRNKLNDGDVLPQRKYYCPKCESENVVAIPPREAAETIETDCETCGEETRQTRL